MEQENQKNWKDYLRMTIGTLLIITSWFLPEFKTSLPLEFIYGLLILGFLLMFSGFTHNLGRIIISFIYVVFLLFFPTLTFNPGLELAALGLMIYIVIGIIISMSYIFKFLSGKLNSKHILLMFVLYSLFWLCNVTQIYGLPVSGLQTLMTVWGIKINLSSFILNIFQGISLVSIIGYVALLMYFSFVYKKS